MRADKNMTASGQQCQARRGDENVLDRHPGGPAESNQSSVLDHEYADQHHAKGERESAEPSAEDEPRSQGGQQEDPGRDQPARAAAL